MENANQEDEFFELANENEEEIHTQSDDDNENENLSTIGAADQVIPIEPIRVVEVKETNSPAQNDEQAEGAVGGDEPRVQIHVVDPLDRNTSR